ncbi:MAG: Carbon monoxide dehydrogenase/acetyl-CoA synthase subunit beta [Dehalococcoidia bacterium]|nr:Carbon monoxide dehydrogenase/acetyl-CoA synthase subunit beta [Bacillota bacterium]
MKEWTWLPVLQKIGAKARIPPLPVHVGIISPVLGSDLVNGLLLQIAHDVFGGHFIWETDPVRAAEKLLEALDLRSWKLKVHGQAAEKFSAPLTTAW